MTQNLLMERHPLPSLTKWLRSAILLPYYSPCPMHLPPVWSESAPFCLPEKRLPEKGLCGRSVWRVILLWESICFWKERSHGDSLLNFPSGSLSTEMNLKLFLAEFSFLRFELIKMLPEIPVTASVFAAGAFPSPLPRLSNSIIFFL